MSKNFPHDNIYSILGKLDALKPTPAEERFALVKEIRESVEAQGSVLEGVGAVEAKLARQFAESQVNEITPDEMAQAEWLKDPKNREAQRYQSAVARGDTEHQLTTKGRLDSQASYNLRKAVDAYKDAIRDIESNRGVGGGNPGGTASDKMGQQITDIIQKAQNGQMDANQAIAFINKQTQQLTGKPVPANAQVNEKAVSQAQQKFMGMVHAAQKGEKPASPEVAKVAKDMGKKDAKDFAATKHKGLPQHVEEETCNECGLTMEGCSCDHTNEGEVTKTKHGIKHTKTDFPGYPSDDLEDDDDRDAPKSKGGKGRPRKATTKNPRKDPNAEKKSVGRPKKEKGSGERHQSGLSKMHDPFGRVKAGAEKKGSGIKGEKHNMSESIMESVNFKRMMEEQHMTLEEMLECMNADMMQFKESGVCSDRLRDMMEVYSHAKRQMEETQGGIGHDLVTPQQRVAQATPQKPGIVGTVKDVVQGAKNWIQGKPEQGPTYEEVDPLEEELSKLAELAGITMAGEGNAFTGKLKNTAKGDKFELDGKEYTDTSTLDEEPEMEGNAFGKAVRDAKANGIQPGEKVTVGGKEYPVKEAQELVAMLRVAGLDTKQLEEALAKNEATYGDTEADGEDEEVEEELANAPDEEYMSMKASTLNPGEADNGEKQMNPDRPTFKNGDNALSKPPVRESVVELESKLAAEYESIKKVS
jgi:hypothetical protein